MSRLFHSLLALVVLGSVAHPAFSQRCTPVKLVHPDGEELGDSVALQGDTLVVGSPHDLTTGGSALVFRWVGSSWDLEDMLTPSEVDYNQSFGKSVSIFGDTAVVGVPSATVGGKTNRGAVYVYTRSGSAWSQQAMLTASDGAASDAFGFSVSVHDDLLVVGAYGVDVGAHSVRGAAYVFSRSGSSWSQQAKLTASDGAAGDEFGWSVSISGTSVLVGAPYHDIGPNADRGAAYVFVQSGTAWSEQGKLTATGGLAGDSFGWSVAISADTALVGAPNDDVGPHADQGSAYVFVRAGAAWTQQGHLLATDGDTYDALGEDVALDGDTAMAGAVLNNAHGVENEGSAYIFVRSGTTWAQQAQLAVVGAHTNDNLGESVALSADLAVAGAPSAFVDNGAAWVFSRVGSEWIGPDLQLLASDGASGEFFGSEVAVSGDTAVIGAYAEDRDGMVNPGAAYVFVRSGTTWIEQAKLVADDAAEQDAFGRAVAIRGDTAVIGAPYKEIDGSSLAGAAYVFTRTGSVWTQRARLTAPVADTQSHFGSCIALAPGILPLGSTVVLIGSPLADGMVAIRQGAAFIFSGSGATWAYRKTLYASDAAASDYFGSSVDVELVSAIPGGKALRAIVGAPFADQLTFPALETDRGAAYVFTSATGLTWTEETKLEASDGEKDDNFGHSVALSDSTALVGAPFHDPLIGVDRGSAYVYVHESAGWSEQTILHSGGAGGNFGYSLDLSVDTAVIGATGFDSSRGCAYLYARIGTEWFLQEQLLASDGAANEEFGTSCSIGGGICLVGPVYHPYSPADPDFATGVAYTFACEYDCFPLALNESTGAAYESLTDALTAASTGQSLLATTETFGALGAVDTGGRALDIRSTGAIRTRFGSSLQLGDSCSLVAPGSEPLELFGDLSVKPDASVALGAGSLLVGAGCVMGVSEGAALDITADAGAALGQISVGVSASLSFSGRLDGWGTISGASLSLLASGGPWTNFEFLSLTTTELLAPLCDNFGQLDVYKSSTITGDFANESGATTTIHSGTLAVTGAFTNAGTVTGTVTARQNTPGTPTNITTTGPFVCSESSSLLLRAAGSFLRVGGDFDSAIDSSARFRLSVLQMNGQGAECALEVMSRDVGDSPAGLDETLAGHFPLGTLRIGPSPTAVRLVDGHDNDARGQTVRESIYADVVQVDAGCRLINGACRIYCNTLINHGTIDVPANVITIGAMCFGDQNYDSLVDDADFSIFVVAYNTLECTDPTMPEGCPADFNQDGIVEDSDFVIFVAAYNELLCP